MDDVVLRAMAKWPDVPAVYGWLGLDRRGRWLLRGEPIGNVAANRFISRNYTHDERGRWFFQNGPQRVFVALERAPWVLSLDGAGSLRTHTGAVAERVESAWIDEGYELLLLSEHGIGLVDDRDLPELSARFVAADGSGLGDAAVEAALAALPSAEGETGLHLGWAAAVLPVRFVPTRALAERFGFDPSPAGPAAPGAEDGGAA